MTEEEAWKLWNERIYKPVVENKVERSVKPRRSFDELAKIKRCGERKRQGLPCNEKLDTPQEVIPGGDNTSVGEKRDAEFLDLILDNLVERVELEHLVELRASYSDAPSPLGQTKSLSVVCNEMVIPFVSGLFLKLNPDTVGGLIVTIVIDSLDSIPIPRFSTHIRKEERKIVPPITDFYSSSSIVLPSGVIYVVTSISHVFPRHIFKCFVGGISMFSEAFTKSLDVVAPTTLSLPSFKIAATDITSITANTSTLPVYSSFSFCLSSGHSYHLQLPKGHTSQISESTHRNSSEVVGIRASIPKVQSENHKSIRVWSYGVTTCVARRNDLLPRTLASLKLAGFDNPRLFVDGEKDGVSWMRQFGFPVTSHEPTIRTFGNWFLGAMELFIREPNADLYAIFQDDFVTYRNLRYYLERCTYPDMGYWNLYTFPSNQQLAPKTVHGGTKEGWYPSNQLGRGAVALVFNRVALLTLFQQQHMIERPLHATRGHRAVDGGIVTALRKVGYTEYVHSPSLVQHTGMVSSMNNQPHLQAVSFRGESFDAVELLSMVEASNKS